MFEVSDMFLFFFGLMVFSFVLLSLFISFYQFNKSSIKVYKTDQERKH